MGMKIIGSGFPVDEIWAQENAEQAMTDHSTHKGWLVNL